jgi:hypothetical protein
MSTYTPPPPRPADEEGWLIFWYSLDSHWVREKTYNDDEPMPDPVNSGAPRTNWEQWLPQSERWVTLATEPETEFLFITPPAPPPAPTPSPAPSAPPEVVPVEPLVLPGEFLSASGVCRPFTAEEKKLVKELREQWKARTKKWEAKYNCPKKIKCCPIKFH